MTLNQNLIKDAHLLSRVEFNAPQTEFTLIYNNADGIQKKIIPATIPVKIDGFETFTIEETTEAFLHAPIKVSSLKSFAVATRNHFSNLFFHCAKPLEFQDSVVLDIRTFIPNNIAHIMLHILPLCLHVKQTYNADVTIVLDKLHAPFRKLLEVFGINPIFTRRKIKGKLIKVFSTRGLAAHPIMDLFDCSTYAFMPAIYERFSFKSGVPGTNKIFIARRGQRGVTNLAEVEKLLTSLGYKTIFMEDYSIEVQLGIASEADEIVAVHGASMGMLALRKKISSLIEIMPPNVYHDYFPVTFSNKIEKHIQIMSYFDHRIPYNGWETIVKFKSAPFAVDIKQLEMALSEVSK
jgi:hypothetical protein